MPWGWKKDCVFRLMHFALANGTCTSMHTLEVSYLVYNCNRHLYVGPKDPHLPISSLSVILSVSSLLLTN